MAIELATAYVSVIPSTKGMAGQLRSEMSGTMETEGERSGAALGGAFGGVAGKALKVGGGAAAGVFAASLAKGFGRLRAIDDARFKLDGLGHDAATVDQIMADALGSVEGTAFGLDEAATIAASAVAAGIKPGADLERILSITGDAASIAGTSIGDMGSIFSKVAAGNRASMREVNQLSDRGIPIMQWLAEEYGVTAIEARKMVEQGAVDFATFSKVIEDNIGGAALSAGESFRGSFANMGAALGRFGAAILGPAFAAAPGVFEKITGALNTVTGVVGPLAERFSGPLTIAVGGIAAILTAVLIPALVTWGVTSTISAAKSVAAWVLAQAASLKSAAIQAVSVARVVAGWVLMGVQSLLHAAKMAVAWVIAMGPVGWVIALVVGLVALIIANWDTVVDWTRKAWAWVSDAVSTAWEWIKTTTAGAVGAVVGFFVGLKDDAVRIVSDLWARVTGFFADIKADVIRAATELAVEAITQFMAMKDGAIEKGRELLTWVGELPGRVLDALGDLGGMLWDAGRDMIQGLLDGAGSLLSRLGRFMLDKVPGWIRGPFERAMGISSPSKVFAGYGVDMMQGLQVGMDSMTPVVPAISAPVLAGMSSRQAMSQLSPSSSSRTFHIENVHVGRAEDVQELGVRLKSIAAAYG